MMERMQKESKRVNAELSNSLTRITALPKLKKLINHQNETILSENMINWVQTLCQLITLDRNASAAEILSLILLQACQVPSISREISTKFIPSILDDFLKVQEKDIIILQAIKSLLECYPTSCGSLRTHVVRTMFALMVSTENEEILDHAARCWALGSFLGGGGHQRSNHSQQWLNQFMDCIAATKFALDCFLGDEKGKIDSSIGSISMAFPYLPIKEPELSDAIIKRFSVICRCFVSLMTVNFPFPLPFPIDTITKIILQILDIVPLQMGNTTEMVHRAEYLPQIHENFLRVFKMLTRICRRNLCRYSYDINNMFSALLDLWKDKSPVQGRHKNHCIIREKVYDAVTDWIENCGATTRFMCGLTILNHNLLRHIIDDVRPIVGTTVVTNKLHSGGGSKKAKRRRLAEATALMSGNQVEQIINPTANEFLTSAALQVVTATVNTMGHRLPEEIARSFQTEVLTILLRLQTSEEVIPYHRCTNSRLKLYESLLSFVLSPSESVAPPTEIAVKIFTSAISCENNSKIRVLCHKGMSSFNNIVHPWRHSWHVYVPTRSTESIAVKETPLMEPMNIVEEDMEADMDDAEIVTESKVQSEALPPPPIYRDIDQNTSSENKENIQPMSNKTENHVATFNAGDSPIKDTTILAKETMEDGEHIENGEREDDKSLRVSLDSSLVKSSRSPVQIETEKADEELQDMMNDFVDASPDHE